MSGSAARPMFSLHDKPTEAKIILPSNLTRFENQVAGHSQENGKSVLGLLKNEDGCIFKPIMKQPQGMREKKFYSDLQHATDTESVELQSFVPKYMGSTVVKVGSEDIEFLVLQNVAQGFSEPCIMDVKIGKQTWGPEATPEKKENESRKYTESKRDLGFCIPGFQVHRISTGKLEKMEKDYGKTLTKHTTKDALKLFLNADSGLSRRLLLQLLAHLWRILRWCRTQHKYRFYSSSLLLVYDAKRLRKCLKVESVNPTSRPATLCSSPISFGSSGSFGNDVNFQSHSPSRGFLEKRSLSRSHSRSGSSSPVNYPSTPNSPVQKQNSVFGFDSWHKTFDKVCLSRTHSFVNNYEIDLENMKDDYTFQLDDLMRSDKPGDKEVWSAVKMIDFAHVFPAPTDEEDFNYLEGIENLVKMIEGLMDEATC